MTEVMKSGQGAKSLPERHWFSTTLKDHMKLYLGLHLTSTQVWNGLSLSERDTITFAYGEGKELSAVHKTLMNLKYFNEELDKVEGHGVQTVWVWQERKKPNIVHTTTTPSKEQEAQRKKAVQQISEAIEPPPLKPKVEPDPLEALLVDHVVQVGARRTFTCVGRLSDGMMMWRDDETGYLGTVGFDSL